MTPANGYKKLISREALAEKREEWRHEKKVVGYTSGVFDLLHPGHVEYLEKSKDQCDILIVGVNSDDSVKKIKGPTRPICSEEARARVIAALSSVNYVFIFSEPNNNLNISVLTPDIYFKAGDYSKEKLSSASIVEKHGGKVVLVPLREGFSTTKTLKSIEDAALDSVSAQLDDISKTPAPALFIDRDGTICEHVMYLHEPEKFKLFPGVLEALKRARNAGYKIIVITNQPGIGLGYFSTEDLFKVNRELLRAAGKAGVSINKIYFCPNSQGDNCECRKPKPGMILKGAKDLNIILEKSYMIGDMPLDAEAGKAAGCKTILVESGEGKKEELLGAKPIDVVKDLAAAVEVILRAT